MRNTEKNPARLHLQSLKDLRTKWHQLCPSDPREPKEKSFIMARLLDDHFWHFGTTNTTGHLLRMLNQRLLSALQDGSMDVDLEELVKEIKAILHLVIIMREARQAYDLSRSYMEATYPESYGDYGPEISE